MTYDTIIIGAGAAGLAAARKLSDAQQSVLVLEARDRIGGRIWTDYDFAEFPMEYGAEFIHGEHAATHELVQAAQFHTNSAPRKAQLRWGSKTRATAVADLPPALRNTIEKLWAAYRHLPTRAYLTNDESLGNYLYRQGFTADEIAMADVLLAQTCCAPINRLSCADLVREMAVDHAGLEEFRIVEGYGALLEEYSKGLRIECNAPIQSIHWSQEGVELVSNEKTYQARRCISTVPVSVLQAGHITFYPALSVSKQAAISAFRTEAATKLLYRFAEPLWDEELVYMMHTGIAARWWTPGYPRPDAAVIACYVTAERAIAVDAMHEEEALTLGLEELAELLGRSDVQAACIAAKRIAWAKDPYALGGYAYIPTGAAAARPILAQPEGNVLFFAGEATAHNTNPQTVHGALESGWRAAGEVLAVGQ
ncbi:MAG: FAD-dependent oxidoreductase [Caldilineaceae bacterium]|nr:FAD-dependent oxidoreductase [Caldilineaceae bacterium]